ncbi:MAG: hypothetical protein M3081_21320 [Gemmatimonadota bacterium]|nr:hypothetical protein [Gemmatimonadota bacterium]
MAITLALIGILAMIALPSSATALAHSRVNRAASMVAVDLDLALSQATRQHGPVQIALTGSTYAFTTRAGDTLHVRSLGTDSEFSLESVTFTPTTVEVFPTGLVSGQLTIVMLKDGYSRTVTMSRAGQVRIIAP